MSRKQSEVNRFLDFCRAMEHEETKKLVREQVQDFFRQWQPKRKGATARGKKGTIPADSGIKGAS